MKHLRKLIWPSFILTRRTSSFSNRISNSNYSENIRIFRRNHYIITIFEILDSRKKRKNLTNHFYNHLKIALPNEMANGSSVLLLNQNATRQNIINSLQDIFSQSNENDFIIFYFSGHGSPGNFCPSDIYNNLEHDIVKNYFKKAKAKYRLCIADACFSGTIGTQQQNTSVENATQNLKDARIAVIMSSKPNQTSAETRTLQQGVFSYYLINGLKGAADLNNDKYVTMGELFIYTKKETAQRSNGKQVPVVYGKNLDRIPLTRLRN